jgi:PAS domain S-box-containing protein
MPWQITYGTEHFARPLWLRGLVAVCIVGAAFGLKIWLLGGIGPTRPYLIFYPAVTLAALFGGAVSGVLATALSTILVLSFFIDAYGHAFLLQARDWLGLAVFLPSCLLVTMVAELMLRTRAGLRLEIAERKRMESDLEKERKLVASILETLPAAIVGTDEAGAVTYFNRKARDVFAKQPSEVSGSYILDALPQLPITREQFEEVRASGKPLRYERSLMRSMLGIRIVDCIVHPHGHAGDGRLTVIVEDVTERFRLEGLMVQTEKMMSVGELAAGMAHEINNPLGGIIQSIQAVLRRLDPDVETNKRAAEQTGVSITAMLDYLNRREIVPMLASARESAVRAARIVTTMLAFSRKEESSSAPTDINLLLDKAVDLSGTNYDLKKKYDFRKIEIVKDYETNLPHVPCTATQIEQVFLNLLSNAAQAMHGRNGGGTPPRITLRTRTEEAGVAIEVEDNGPGMPEDVRRRIFEPFFTTKPPGEGTGLGLSVSYFIIASTHKGTIEADSQPGQGTRFTIHLPLTGASSAVPGQRIH